MNDSVDLMEWFKNTFRESFEDIKDVQNWKVLNDAAIYRKHTGDIDGAIEAMEKVIRLTRTQPHLAERTASSLNYLADLYLLNKATDQAQEVLKESIELSRPRFPGLLADNLWMMAGIQSQKGEHRAALASAEEAHQLYQQQGHTYGAAQAKELIEKNSSC